MTERLEIVFSHIKKTESLADVGCDHGYIAKACLDRGVTNSVIISDVSSKSLQKAKELLKNYGDKVVPVVTDGFTGFPFIPETAVIAGMGGEEIVHILLGANTLPKRLVLAPQKNSDKVRRTLTKKGYKIEKDFTFFSSGKYYDLITCSVGKDSYTELEYLFGRDNLKDKGKAFIDKINKEIELLNGVINSETASASSKAEALSRLAVLKEIL
ncbi:MAG: SAM-dependent methyltransferase [Clostridia bacterium]|nr:SAM-dependent methyltransferase [Clostridia bacterium]